jgi:ribonucleoside-diphosphate reductase alpha chain
MSTKSTVPDLPLFSANGNHATMKKKLLNTTTHPKNYLTPLGEKIFLDRYAWKDGSKKSLAEGDTVIVCVDEKTRQREIGVVESLDRDEMKAVVRLRDDTTKAVAIEHIDKPLETTPDQTMARIARGIAAVESEAKQAEWQKKFEWLLEDWKFVPGGRIWAGAGTDQELTFYNCYVVPSPHDSRGGIVKTLQQMMEIMSRGGGVGINVSSLRPRYGYVKGVNGRSSGAVSWGGLYSFVTGLIEQGGSRRGALMLICNDWHPDVMEFINSKREAGKITNANISVGISDAFMEAVKQDSNWDLVFPDTLHPAYDTEWNGELETWQTKGYPVIRHKTVKAREMWNQIIESAWASAEPGLWFRERANKMSNSWYFSQLICTNPCVTADTLVYTANGLRRVGDLFAEGNNVNVVVDGRHGYAPTTSQASHIFRTGRKQIYRLQTKEGYYVRATGDHRIMTERGWVALQDLTQADKVHILNRKGGFGTEGTQELGQILGWLVGDGTIKEDQVVLSFFGQEKQELAGMFAQNVENIVAPLTLKNRYYTISPVTIKDRDEVRVASTRLHTVAAQHGLVADKYTVPASVFTGSEAMQRGFLQALFTADGGFQDGGVKGGSARLASNHLELLEGVQQLLLNFGIASRIYRNRRTAGYRNLPDGNGGLKSYWCEAQHELAITKSNLDRFARDIGFLMEYKQAKLTDYIQRGKRGTYSERFTAHVESITPDGIEDVYDLTEPMTHSFIGNGITLHNCGEQPLPSFGICNLGAVNLAKFVKDGAVEWEMLGQTVRYATRFLDDVIDATPYFFAENAEQQGKERRVGLGVMGLAEMMIRLGLRYGSDEGNAFLDELFKFFASEAYRASADIAAEKGAFPAFDADKFLQSGFMLNMPEDVRDTIRDKGARNVTLLTVAPTGTTGTMVSTSTGVEPYYFWSYFRKSRLGVHEEVVDVVQAWRDENPDTDLPDYFVTAMDLSPEDHVKVQAVVQKWIDSSISKTCNVPNHYTVEQTAELYRLMYELGCKGGTIYRDGSRDEQVLNIKKEEKKEEPKVGAAHQVVEPPTTAPKSPAPYISPNYTNIGDHKRKRARRLKGATYFVHTPVGKAFVTVNRNGEEEPFEVFANVGKVGSEGAAMSEALGRLISLVLRIPSHITPSERLEMVVDQLGGIGGARSIGFGANRVASLPDALAQVLREDLEAHRQDEAAILLGEADPEPHQLELLAVTAQADLCPECGHASFIRIEGCKKCVSCGHAEC